MTAATDFPIHWDNPEDAKLHWTRDTVHEAKPSLPAGMLQDLLQLVVCNGAGTTVLYQSAPLARGVTSAGPIGGFVVGQAYSWNVIAFGPSGTGFPACGRLFNITSSTANSEQPVVEEALPNRRSERYPQVLELRQR